MKTLCLLSVFVALGGCGDGKQGPKDATSGSEPMVDAALYPPCATAPVRGTNVTFRQIGMFDHNPVLATSPPNDPRLFVVEQTGVIWIFKDEVRQPTAFLDLRSARGGPVVSDSVYHEHGMLGLAFHPQFATNGQFFVYYTSPRNGDLHSVIARCQVNSTNPDAADPNCVDVLVYRRLATNHQGGMIEFGPDGYLWIGTGDGGGGGDPDQNGQSLVSFHGKMLRLDVDNKAPNKEYGIPSDNPYATGGGFPEIYMRGLRNPWRWSFDRGTGDIWIGDVGQDLYEELNVAPPAKQRNANFGWSIYEGPACCDTQGIRCKTVAPPSSCDPTGITFPKDSRAPGPNETGWRSIIGGVTYRGSCFPDLYGWHLYTDWNQREIVRARLKADETLEIIDTGILVPDNPSSIYTDARGEMYLTSVGEIVGGNTIGGNLYRIEIGP